VTVRRVDFTLAVEKLGLLIYTQDRPAEGDVVKLASASLDHCLIPLFLPFQRQFAPLGKLSNQKAGWTKGKHNKGSGVMGGNGALNFSLPGASEKGQSGPRRTAF
jgi:hypothetical protein